MAEELVNTLEGPKGRVEIFEIAVKFEGGGQRFEYEVRSSDGKKEIFKSCGEAYIVAGEMAGVKT